MAQLLRSAAHLMEVQELTQQCEDLVSRQSFDQSKVGLLEHTVQRLQEDTRLLQAQNLVYKELLQKRRQQWRDAHHKDDGFDDGHLEEDSSLEACVATHEVQLNFHDDELSDAELEKLAGHPCTDRREAMELLYTIMLEHGASATMLFKKADRDRSGFISVPELRRCLLLMSINIREADLTQLFLELDTDNNGRIHYQELKDNIIATSQRMALIEAEDRR